MRSAKLKKTDNNKTTKEFTDLSIAFDYCREANKPVLVMVQYETWKLFPSGHAKQLVGGSYDY